MGLLRVALAMAVLLSHLPPASVHFVSGALAVQGFFIVSGFYMALVLKTKYRAIGLFYSNRLARLLPAYFVMLAISAILLFVFNVSATSRREIFNLAYANPASALWLIAENLGLVGQDLLYWFRIAPDGSLPFDPTGAPASDASPAAWQALLVPQSWSLSLELMFYALAPFLARLSWRWLAGLAGASMALRLAGYLLPLDYGLWQGRFFPTALFLFLLGMLAHRALPFAARLPKATGFALAAAILALVAFLPAAPLDLELARWLAYFAIAATIPFIFHAFQDLAFDRWIGDLSYPIYLCHLAVIGWVLTFNTPYPVWVAIGGTLGLSVLLLLAIDRPVDRWRQRRALRLSQSRPA